MVQRILDKPNNPGIAINIDSSRYSVSTEYFSSMNIALSTVRFFNLERSRDKLSGRRRSVTIKLSQFQYSVASKIYCCLPSTEVSVVLIVQTYCILKS